MGRQKATSLVARSVLLANRGVFAHAATEVVLTRDGTGAPVLVVDPYSQRSVSFSVSAHVRTESESVARGDAKLVFDALDPAVGFAIVGADRDELVAFLSSVRQCKLDAGQRPSARPSQLAPAAQPPARSRASSHVSDENARPAEGGEAPLGAGASPPRVARGGAGLPSPKLQRSARARRGGGDSSVRPSSPRAAPGGAGALDSAAVAGGTSALARKKRARALGAAELTLLAAEHEDAQRARTGSPGPGIGGGDDDGWLAVAGPLSDSGGAPRPPRAPELRTPETVRREGSSEQEQEAQEPPGAGAAGWPLGSALAAALSGPQLPAAALSAGRRALPNLGNTCYLNATLQALGCARPLHRLLAAAVRALDERAAALGGAPPGATPPGATPPGAGAAASGAPTLLQRRGQQLRALSPAGGTV